MRWDPESDRFSGRPLVSLRLPSLRFFIGGDDALPNEPMFLLPKRTCQPSTIKRKRTHGYLARQLMSTTCLALGTRKMALKNALVRKLPRVEMLGCTMVVYSDMTGTLMTNQMSTMKLVAIGRWTNQMRSFKVEGMTYDPIDGKIEDLPTGLDANLQIISKIAAIYNDASIVHAAHQYVASGMLTEAALKVLVEEMGLPAKNDLSLVLVMY